MEGTDIDSMADVCKYNTMKYLLIFYKDGDMNAFDNRMKKSGGLRAATNDDSSDDDALHQPINRNDPVAVLEEKNRILLDRLYKSEKQLEDMSGTYEALATKNESLKDKKIIELSKKNRALMLQAESLKTKAAKAAEFALDLKKENDKSFAKSGTKPNDSMANSSDSPGTKISSA